MDVFLLLYAKSVASIQGVKGVFGGSSNLNLRHKLDDINQSSFLILVDYKFVLKSYDVHYIAPKTTVYNNLMKTAVIHSQKTASKRVFHLSSIWNP